MEYSVGYKMIEDMAEKIYSQDVDLVVMPGDIFIIMLVHEPIDLGHISNLGADIHLAGHTHAGQFFPLTVGTKSEISIVNINFKGEI